jgi:hypothetical protein
MGLLTGKLNYRVDTFSSDHDDTSVEEFRYELDAHGAYCWLLSEHTQPPLAPTGA